jgi:hypothetical protein
MASVTHCVSHKHVVAALVHPGRHSIATLIFVPFKLGVLRQSAGLLSPTPLKWVADEPLYHNKYQVTGILLMSQWESSAILLLLEQIKGSTRSNLNLRQTEQPACRYAQP